MNINTEFQSALKYYNSGDFRRAASICETILEEKPNEIPALHFLGIVYQQLQNYDAAIRYLRTALQLEPDSFEGFYNLASAFHKKGALDEAIDHYQKVIQLNPNFVDARLRLGDALRSRGRFEEAISCYQKAIEITPDNAGLYFSLGTAFQDGGNPDEAISCYRKALGLNLNIAAVYNNLGLALQEKGQIDEAITNYRKALDLDPRFAEVFHNLGLAFQKKGQTEEAIACYQRSVQLRPDFADAYLNLGIALQREGRHDEATAAYGKVLLLKPHDFRARFAKCISQLPIIYPEHSHIRICRDRYFDELIKLRDAALSGALEDLNSAADAVGLERPFFLAYQGLNDRELQNLYGNFICRIMSLRYPEFAGRPAMPPHPPGETLRIGFVSGFFRIHSNWKIPIRGWIEQMDREQFSLYGYYTGNKKDKATGEARKSFTRFVEDITSFEELCRIIRDDDLHVLIYPEIGMDSTTARLASLRLAPIQCTSWGHPDTSGLPTIDYFLSSDLMEPPDADDHYSEKLVRLPNLSVYYIPLDSPPSDIDRRFFNLRRESVIYLCCQSLFKYLPQYDEIYPRIAKEAGDCKFVFLVHDSSYVTGQFQRRITQAFGKFGLKAGNYVVFLPRLDRTEYNAINSLSDIYLDSIGWSGCNSTFEATGHGLPIVTLPGELMRSRHSSAILAMMGTTDTVASTIDEYIGLAVRLGVDPEWRKQISEKIGANRHRAYRDKTCITALGAFLQTAVKAKLT